MACLRRLLRFLIVWPGIPCLKAVEAVPVMRESLENSFEEGEEKGQNRGEFRGTSKCTSMAC